jgi:hypothetical protein
MASYRISFLVEPGVVNWFEDIDLPLLLSHGGEAVSGCHSPELVSASQLQPLPSGRPSALPGQRCQSLLFDARELGSDVHLVSAIARVGGGDKPAVPIAAADEVQIKEGADALEISVSGKPFVTYRYNTKDPELPRPYFHPVLGPSGKTITQLGEIPGKKEAHFHHTALWIAHQNFAAKGQPACDNWQMNKNCTRIEHLKFEAVESGALAARFIEKLNWLNHKGDKTLLAETRTVTIPKRPAESRVLDIDIRLMAQDLPVTFNKTPYHLLAVRVLNAMLPAKGGVMINSEGQKNPGDGAPAKWIDISGKLDDELQGVALFNHPDNPRQPTPCLQFAGQTIGLAPSHKEPLTIDAGKEVRFRYRVLVHAGGVEEAKVGDEYDTYCTPKMGRIQGIERMNV